MISWIDNSFDYATLELKPGVEIQEDCYITLTIRSIRLRSSRIGFKRFYGATISSLKLPRESEVLRVSRLISPESLGLSNVDSTRLDRILIRDQMVVDRVAYKGGKIGIDVVLVAMQSDDLSAPYFALAGSILNAFSPGVLAATKGLQGPVEKVWEQISGKSAEIQIGIGIETLCPKSGIFAVIATPQSEVSSLSLSPEGHILKDGREFQETYIVFELSCHERKPDFAQIPEIAEAYGRVTKTLRENDYTSYESAMNAFRTTCLLSPDLIEKDAKVLVSKVESMALEILPGGATSGADKPSDIPDLTEIGIY